MFIVLLRFTANKGKAGGHMAEHGQWIQRGFADGIFLLAGSLQPGLGGGILAHNTTRSELQSRVDADPFVAHDIVRAEIIEIAPSKADARLESILAACAPG